MLISSLLFFAVVFALILKTLIDPVYTFFGKAISHHCNALQHTAILLVEPKVFVLMEVLLKRKGSSPESIMFQRFYDDTWSVITKIEFVLVVSSTMAEVRLPQRDS